MHIDNPDVILIGSGIMSANLGAMLKRLQPELKIQLYEVSDEVAQESSHAWNNAGTGHAGICELSYTPDRKNDGTVDVSNAITIFEQFDRGTARSIPRRISFCFVDAGRHQKLFSGSTAERRGSRGHEANDSDI